MNFSLGKNWENYVSQQVQSGQFNNASEVVRDALRRQPCGQGRRWGVIKIVEVYSHGESYSRNSFGADGNLI